MKSCVEEAGRDAERRGRERTVTTHGGVCQRRCWGGGVDVFSAFSILVLVLH